MARPYFVGIVDWTVVYQKEDDSFDSSYVGNRWFACDNVGDRENQFWIRSLSERINEHGVPVPVPMAQASRLRAIGMKIADEDIDEDGPQ